MKERKRKIPTVKQIQSYLSKEQLMNSISSYSIRRILKAKLMFSFKKLNSLEHNSNSQLKVKKFMESSMLQLTLKNEGYELLFIDEFSLSYRYNNYYGRTEKVRRITFPQSTIVSPRSLSYASPSSNSIQ